MSVRVNLLPREIGERERARRHRIMAGLAGVAVVAAMGGAYTLQLRQVAAAEQALADERAELAALQSDLAELAPYDQLDRARTEADAELATALGGEVSIAGVLQDVAAVVPADVALTTVAIALEPTLLEDAPTSVGRVTLEGMTVDGHRPGVERFLLALDASGSLHDVTLSRSELDEDLGATLLNAEAQLDVGVRTDRYQAGLPEVLR